MAASGVSDLAGFLTGLWALAREVVADDGRCLATFRGHGRFEPLDDPTGRLAFEERGTLEAEGHATSAARRLLYDVAGPVGQVRFADDRPFHDLDLRTGVWRVEHPCGQDHYTGRFSVVDHDTWQHRWQVHGPSKAYTVRTRLTRSLP